MAQRYNVIGYIKDPVNYFKLIYQLTKNFVLDTIQPRASILLFDDVIGYFRAFKQSINTQLLVTILSQEGRVDLQKVNDFINKKGS